MITLETIVACALRSPIVLDRLGEALRSDLVLANPYLRRIVIFADDFLLNRRKLPGDGDWSVWLETLPENAIRDGTREALGRLLAISTGSYDPEFLAESAIGQLRTAAAQVARARLNEQAVVDPETFVALVHKLDAVQGGNIGGLARLADIDTWSTSPREEEYIPTGLPTLNRLVGGWGKELWMVFADSGVGKSMLLQNFATAAALRGARVLHVTLELGLRPQIHRYYRQIAQSVRADFTHEPDVVKDRLRHWFRLAKGEVCVMEFPAFGLDHEELRRTVERVGRTIGPINVLILDYLDLLIVAAGKRGRGGAYEDLGRLTHEVRDLCRAFDLTVLTASQAVRRPQNKGRLTVRDMGDSYQKVRAADGLLSLVQTEEEEAAHQGRIGVLKVRDGGGRGTEIPVYINRELSLIAEVGHPNTVALMTKLGHLPGQVLPLPGVGTP